MRIYDNIHGYITISELAESIINTPVFQRLRNIHQTGVLYLVFPTATHSRFEHSIGTYHLANKMITSIKMKQPELGVTDEIVELVSIAGLCHDLGHCMFSHLFDDYFLPKLPNYNELGENTTHEIRSISLLNYIVERYNVNLNKEQLKVIGDLINPKTSEYDLWEQKYMVGKWIFQIISNPVNSIDVDKFDYLTRDTMAVGLKFSFDYSRIIDDARVIDMNICYSSQCSEDIYHMFFIRYRLHRMIYNHKVVKAIELLVLKQLFEIEKEKKISNYILNPEKTIDLVDSYIWSYKTEIMERINTRKFPKMIYQHISLEYEEPNDIEYNNIKEQYDDKSYEIIRFQVGYVGGKTNPLNRIYFYNLKNNKIIAEQNLNNFSLLINQNHLEYFLRIYLT
jgi:HD superfamily phosphohydrolase